MDDPLLVGGFERLADLTRDRQRFIQRESRPRAIRSASVSPSTSSRTSAWVSLAVLEPVDRADVRMVQRGQHLRLALETGEAIGIEREGVRHDLQRDLAIQLRVARAIHLAHAAGAEGGEDFIRADSGAGTEGQTLSIIRVRRQRGLDYSWWSGPGSSRWRAPPL